ncbi:oxidoreductase [Nocardioides mangrovicus]|uniref:Oxidoreductase n=1 Tax=Nocardioides mangrovicus TaxID=2478913 RepID=A0A3L8P305_9ACTN|nr:glucose-6-phosphate dehydrogenase assembly protein OpcA [Nocardioides mangrovicus]RLV49352.1 oxidoreductase [Nocardioides mangrovicus]
MIELSETTSSAIAAEFVAERARHGSPAMGMVMTMVILVDEDSAHQALDDARRASHEHPARVLGVIIGDGRGKGRVDAQIGIGDAWGGEVALIRLSGEVTKHADSVVMPLLLPDSPVVVWWPNDHPVDPASDPVGLLAQRRITDAASVRTGKANALRRLCAAYAPGTTDLAWTRLTPWRALLAAALDQQPLKVRGAVVTAEKVSPSADLLAAWLADRLKVKVTRETSPGPGITSVVLQSKEGPVEIERLDGRLATFRSPDNPDRPVALKRRDVPDLLAEELRRLDEDDVYAATAKKLVAQYGRTQQRRTPSRKATAS